jgi:hypothetical protein
VNRAGRSAARCDPATISHGQKLARRIGEWHNFISMRAIAVLLMTSVLAQTSCSFVAVHGPDRPHPQDCTDSDIVPSIDSVAGTLLVAGAIGGEIADHVATHGIANYELVLGLPALVVGIVYLVAASRGTEEVTRCRETIEAHGRQLRGCDGCAEPVP